MMYPKLYKDLLLKPVYSLVSLLFLLVLFAAACIVRFLSKNKPNKPRLVWGSTPIINNSYWSRAMRSCGYTSNTFTTDFYSIINCREDWDFILSEKYSWISEHLRLKQYLAFLEALFKYDVFFISFNGFLLGNTPLRFFQACLLKIARKKAVLIPYGSDSYVYSRVRSIPVVHGLLMSYPAASRIQKRIAKNVDYWVEHADVVIPGLMGPDGFGRWDVLTPSPLIVNTEMWKPSQKLSASVGSEDAVVIVHAPNHRGFKGTEFVIEAVKQLKMEGLNIELRLLEKLQNTEVRRILTEEADILVEQLIFTGHGLNGLEGMACALPTISNLEDESYTLPMRRWSYFGECPLVSATPENLTDVLRKLVTRPQLRHELGKAGRAYVEKYHGYDSAHYLFSNVIDYIYGRKESLINLYHPLLGEYPNRSPKIQHPLVNNRIID